MSSRPTIPLVLIGVTRTTALHTANAFAGTPYYVSAALDKTESPVAYQLSNHNLSVVLHASHPRPRGIITGTAVTGDELRLVERAWEEYKDGILVSRNQTGVWVAISPLYYVYTER